MQLSLPTPDMMAAFGRHVVSYAAGAITVGVGFHVLSSDQGNSLGTAIGQVVSGVETTMGGLATIFSLGAGLYAAWTASPVSQAKSLVRAVPGTTIMTDPAIAAATPAQPTIVSNVAAPVTKS